MRRALALLMAVFIPLLAWANSDFVVKAVTQSVKGKKLIRVALRPMPNSNSMQMTIFTSDGENTLILSKNHIKTALQTLNNPRLIGADNVLISQHFINSSPHMKKYVTFSMAQKTVPSPAVAIVSPTILAANQQASR